MTRTTLRDGVQTLFDRGKRVAWSRQWGSLVSCGKIELGDGLDRCEIINVDVDAIGLTY